MEAPRRRDGSCVVRLAKAQPKIPEASCFPGTPGTRHLDPCHPLLEAVTELTKDCGPCLPLGEIPAAISLLPRALPSPSWAPAPSHEWAEGWGFFSPLTACRALAKCGAQPRSAWFEEEKGVLLFVCLGFLHSVSSSAGMALASPPGQNCSLLSQGHWIKLNAGGGDCSPRRRGLGCGPGSLSFLDCNLLPGLESHFQSPSPCAAVSHIHPTRISRCRESPCCTAPTAPEKGEEKSLREVSALFKTEQNFTH